MMGCWFLPSRTAGQDDGGEAQVPLWRWKLSGDFSGSRANCPVQGGYAPHLTSAQINDELVRHDGAISLGSRPTHDDVDLLFDHLLWMRRVISVVLSFGGGNPISDMVTEVPLADQILNLIFEVAALLGVVVMPRSEAAMCLAHPKCHTESFGLGRLPYVRCVADLPGAVIRASNLFYDGRSCVTWSIRTCGVSSREPTWLVR
ncbi:hypothetical protein BHM03_00031325 [Ensete ventricosum]|nr:hypothetical protein BHM03_00031325 [Ensete ventricosum]